VPFLSSMVTVSLAHFMRNLDWVEGDCQRGGATKSLMERAQLVLLARAVGWCECLPDELHVGLCKCLRRTASLDVRIMETFRKYGLLVLLVACVVDFGCEAVAVCNIGMGKAIT